MATRCEPETRAPDGRLPARLSAGACARGRPDQVQELALVAQARRAVLLNTYRHRLHREDLEDCYGQATVELLAQARRGAVAFSTRAHMANVLELRFVSRIQDRRRVLRGRSPAQAALDHALSLNGCGGEDSVEVEDPRADTDKLVTLRLDLRALGRVVHELTPDQRLVLSSAIDTGVDCVEFCRRSGWSKEKYRKVAQRARARLRELLAREEKVFPAKLSRLAPAVGEGDRDHL